MNRTQRILLLVAVALLVVTWLFPPLLCYMNFNRNEVWTEYRFLFHPSTFGLVHRTIDWGRLALSDAIIVAVGALVIYLRK